MSPYNSHRFNPINACLALFLFVVICSFFFTDFLPSFPTGQDITRPKASTNNQPDKPRPPRPAWVSDNPSRLPDTHHEYLPNGLLKTNMKGEHPMLELIAEGERKRETMINRQSKTLSEAVVEYKRRYHRPPPRGFGEWYEFAVRHNFLLIDEFDQIDRDITPLYSFPDFILRQRLQEVRRLSETSGFIITASPSRDIVNISGPAFTQERSTLLHSNILAFSRWLPEVEIYANGNDRSPRILSAQMRQWVADKKGVFSEAELVGLENVIGHGGNNIFSACPIPPAPNFRVDTEMAKSQSDSPTFIHDPVASSDFCLHPALAHLHGSLSIELHARDPKLLPEFVWAKTSHAGEILLPFMESFNAFTLTRPHPWSEKTHDKLFWRGMSTGSHHQLEHGGPLGWKGGSQRLRAAFLFANESSFSKAPWVSSNVDVLVPGASGGLQTRTFPRSALNELYTDVGLVKPLLQCEQADGTCAEMDAEVPWRVELGTWGIERGKWKYVLDLDANGHGADFQKSLGLGSVVLKSTVFSQWNSDWLVPYYHYIPIKQDFSDIHNVMAFFAGPPSSAKGILEVDGNRGYDRHAQKIGENAERFVREQWRWEDIQVYVYRLLLEYARLVSEDRDGMNYRGAGDLSDFRE